MSKGTWFVRSTIDPRWNKSGDGLVGGFEMPKEAKEHIEKMKQELGEMPDDLEWEYMKD